MKELQPFQNEQFGQLRGHVDESDQPWFCGKDIAAALDYPESSLSQINNLMGAIPEEWKGHKPIMTPGGVQEMLCLTEQGVYFFLGRSDKPKALPYQKWVAGEIMPSIRKTGGYKAKPRPRPTDSGMTSRAHAATLRQMARMTDVYTAAKRAFFLAEAASILGGNPIERYLPAITDGRESWQSPTQLGIALGRSANTIGRALTALGLHGKDDPEHKWSQPLADKSPYSNKEVVSYVYDPKVVLSEIKKLFGDMAASLASRSGSGDGSGGGDDAIN
jgi:prophage antirepressor-like protein